MAGSEPISAPKRARVRRFCLPLWFLACAACNTAAAQTLYKYQGEDGEWIYSDRPPADKDDAETRTLTQRSKRATMTVTHAVVGDEVVLTAHNEFFAPMEVGIEFDELSGVEPPDPDEEMTWVVAPKSDRVLLRLAALDEAELHRVTYRYAAIPGDPAARHQPGVEYRVPFSVGKNFPITQAYPVAITHQSIDSRYAVDIAMPIGTDIVAARGGVVFDIAFKNFRAGLDLERDGKAANVVLILHDDGSYAMYAHLNWNSIRVNPGDRVKAGEYIADSGNTGYSTGPHLHFAVQRNAGARIDSLPVVFSGPGSSTVVPAAGAVLTAYP